MLEILTQNVYVLMAAYLFGALCIVLLTLSIGWIVVWKCVLARMPFIQELFDLNATEKSRDKGDTKTFEDRFQQYKSGV